MDLDFTPEQDLLREMVRGVCSRYGGLDVVRKMENDPIGYSDLFWSQLGELGVTAMTIPEEHGGSGMTMLDAVIVYEELGRALTPSPHFVSSIVGGGVIAALGTDDQRTRWLPLIATGEAIVTPAWIEPGRGFGPAGIQLRARPATGGWKLTGTKRHVAFAGAATSLCVLARTAEGSDGEAVVLLLVDPRATGVTLKQQHTLASDTQYQVDFDEVFVPDDCLLAGQGQGGVWPAWQQVMHDGCVLQAALAEGGARRALEMTVQYAKDRRQFDKPLGAFQSIGHYLADAVTTVDGAETLVWEAGWARSAGRSISRLAPMAKLFAGQTYRDVTAMAQQVFGGIGFTVEYDIQLFFRRAKQFQLSWWDTRYLEELVAADVLGEVTA
jgi:alkylation response protein AidB-like acyl-CoA dehydrogenase